METPDNAPEIDPESLLAELEESAITAEQEEAATGMTLFYTVDIEIRISNKISDEEMEKISDEIDKLNFAELIRGRFTTEQLQKYRLQIDVE